MAGRWVRTTGKGTGTGPSRSGGEDAVADAGAGLAVVQGAEPGRETLIGVVMLGGDGVDVPDGLDHAGRVGQERAGRLRFEVEVEAAQAVAVFGQVVREEQDRPAGHRVVEHGRG